MESVTGTGLQGEGGQGGDRVGGRGRPIQGGSARSPPQTHTPPPVAAPNQLPVAWLGEGGYGGAPLVLGSNPPLDGLSYPHTEAGVGARTSPWHPRSRLVSWERG